MEYDEKIKRAEAIIVGLEQAEALGMDEYRQRAAEAEALLKDCQTEIERLKG